MLAVGLCIGYTDTMKPLETLRLFDAFLEKRQLYLDGIVIGGTALNLLGVVSRTTRDCDLLLPPLSPEIVNASRLFAFGLRKAGTDLADDWLNNGPASLVRQLPAGWEGRLQIVFRGKALELRSLGRRELLFSKLFALCDRSIDLADCIALAPSADELREQMSLLQSQDANPDWPAHVRATLEDLAKRLGHVL
jgi:hypothetical protein